MPEAAAPEAAADSELGYLIADTHPWARVLVDGEDTHKMTPIAPRAKISLKPGKHVITFVVGSQPFDYTIMVAPGQDYSLSKTLPVSKTDN
jgi:hypothetical protein